MRRFVSEMRVEATREKVWNLYTDPSNLPKLTLPHLHLRILRADLPLKKGSRIVFGMRRGPVPITWQSVITEFEPHRLFEDSQTDGPFDHWVHRHEFDGDGTGTLIRDTLEIGEPRGVFGRMAAAIFLDHEIQELFRHRERVVRAMLESEKKDE